MKAPERRPGTRMSRHSRALICRNAHSQLSMIVKYVGIEKIAQFFRDVL